LENLSEEKFFLRSRKELNYFRKKFFDFTATGVVDAVGEIGDLG